MDDDKLYEAGGVFTGPQDHKDWRTLREIIGWPEADEANLTSNDYPDTGDVLDWLLGKGEMVQFFKADDMVTAELWFYDEVQVPDAVYARGATPWDAACGLAYQWYDLAAEAMEEET